MFCVKIEFERRVIRVEKGHLHYNELVLKPQEDIIVQTDLTNEELYGTIIDMTADEVSIFLFQVCFHEISCTWFDKSGET